MLVGAITGMGVFLVFVLKTALTGLCLAIGIDLGRELLTYFKNQRTLAKEEYSTAAVL